MEASIMTATAEDEGDKTPMPSFTEDGFMQASTNQAQADDAGEGNGNQNLLDEGGYYIRPSSGEADTERAMKILLNANTPSRSTPPLDPALRGEGVSTPTQAVTSASPAPGTAGSNHGGPEEGADAAAVPGTKRKAGTPRINMLARGGACEFCKKRKLKCSAEQPSCLACVRAGKECIYSQKKQRSKVRMLEDRLAELEKKLDEPLAELVAAGAVGTALPDTSATVETPAQEFWDRLAQSHGTTPVNDGAGAGTHAAMPELGFTFGDMSNWGAEVNGLGDLDALGGLNGSSVETTLMTLADAAASDVIPAAGFVWESMSEVDIASEIVKAVEGGKGIGEKIVGHL
jgi:hypothetical protein